MKIKLLKITELKPYKRNARKNKQAIEVVKKSIEQFGFRNPILIDKNNVIIAGHTRLEAAKQLNMLNVPVSKIEDLTEDQVKAFRIMDNKSSEFAQWDYDLLKEELHSLEDTDAYDFTGFDSKEITSIWDEPVTNSKKVEQVDKLGKHIIECPNCKHRFERK